MNVCDATRGEAWDGCGGRVVLPVRCPSNWGQLTETLGGIQRYNTEELWLAWTVGD